ncbi:MAG: alpha/beta fold hydrolase [Paracoccaceae bacterium]|jgi:pimeloyl-ACP methyl ester carboxylesterase
MAVEVIAGRRTGVRYAGIGEPAVLLHCSLAHSGAWGGVMAGLADRLSMLAVDLPGHGETEFDPASDGQTQACETTIALLERMDRPANLIGHSFGATVAMRIAITRPDLVASLSLYEPVYFSLLAEGNPEAHARERADASKFLTHLVAGDMHTAAVLFLELWGGPGGFKSMSKPQQDYILKTIPHILNNSRSVMEGHQGSVDLSKVANIKAPFLLMEGGLSPEPIRMLNDLLVATLPTVQRHVFETAAHMGPISQASDVTRVVRAFLFGDET